MFYRIKDDKVYDYADYNYSDECIETDLCTMSEYQATPNKWIIGEVEEEIEVPDYDEDGNIIGYHTEIITEKRLVPNPNWEEEQYIRREREFNKAFFNTSLGYIRRSVTMADGSHKDFLSDLVLSIKAGLEQGLDVKLLAYDKPPFDRDIEDWTIYQHVVSATPQFIMECLMQTSNDFLPINEEE